MIYRRPPSRPIEAEPDGLWFDRAEHMDGRGTDGAPDASDLGPVAAGGSGRVSFGFTDEPISPNRPISPARPPSTEPVDLDAAGDDARAGFGKRGEYDEPAPQGYPADQYGGEGDGAPAQYNSAAEFSAAQLNQFNTGQFNAGPFNDGQFDTGQFDTGQFNATAEFAGPAPFTPAPFTPAAFTPAAFTPAAFTPASQYHSAADFNASARADDGAADTGSRRQPGRLDPVDLDWVPAGTSTSMDDRSTRWAVDNLDLPAPWKTGGMGDDGATGERRPDRRDQPPGALDGPERPRQSRLVTVGIAALSVVVLLAGTVVGVAYYSGSDDKLDSVLQLGAGETTNQAVTAPLDNRRKASFELLSGANLVNLSIGELGDDLYRISTPEDAGIRPNPVIRNDEVKLQVTPDGNGTGGEIDVVLAAKVNWSLRFSGYVEQQILDLTGGQVSGIEMVAGTRRAELSLSKPTGTVPLKINGAVDELILKSPAGSPVRVRVDGGAKTVVAGTRTLRDVPAGSTVTPKNWATQNRYDVAAGARITSLTVANA